MIALRVVLPGIAVPTPGYALSCNGMPPIRVALYGARGMQAQDTRIQPVWCPALAKRFQYEWLL